MTITRQAVLAPIRDWLRSVAAVTAITGTDPTNSTESIYAGGLAQAAVLPAVVITKVGGVEDGVADDPLVQFDCWADKGKAAQAEQLAAAVKTALVNLTNGTTLGSGQVRAMGAHGVFDIGPLTDPDDGRSRYVVQASVTTKVVAA